jgi:hypothetical protein
MLRSRTARSTTGATWVVRRRWARRPRWRRLIGGRQPRREGSSSGRDRDWWFLDFPLNPLDFFDDLPGVAAILLFIAAIIFMIFVGIPLLIFLVETLLIIPALVFAGVIGRVLFGRPWTIEAMRIEPPGGPTIAWNIVGWRASGRAAQRMTTLIHGAGIPPADPPADLAGSRIHRRLPR